MQTSIDDGLTIITPAETVTINKFKGYGYIIFNPKTGVLQLKIGSNDIARLDYTRDGMEVSNYIIKDSSALMSSLGYDITNATSRNMKGAFGEKLTNELVRAENRTPFFSSKHNVNHHGFDNISIESD